MVENTTEEYHTTYLSSYACTKMIEPLFIISLARSDDEMESDTEDTECVTPSEKKMPTKFIPWYRAAKSIYNSGPEGEGQDMWKALKTYQQGRKEHEKEMSTPWQRRDSGISRSSAEVPIVSERRVRSIVDTNKPLPPVPRMSPAPKTRWKKMHPISSGQSPKKPRMENDAARIWWKPQSAQAQPSLKSKISYPGPLMTSNTGENANVPAEYGGIGGPSSAVYLHVTRTGTPLAQPQNTSAPIKKEAKNPSPSNLVPVASRLKTKMDAKGKGKAPLQDDNPPMHWRNVVLGSAFEAGKLFKQNAMGKLDGVYAGRRRKSSDVSFVCRGVPDEWLDRDQVSNDRMPDQIAGAHDKNPMPGPWFAADRDTEFYQAYFEVLDDY